VYTEQEEIFGGSHVSVDGICRECGVEVSFFTSQLGEYVSGRRIAFSYFFEASGPELENLLPRTLISKIDTVVRSLKADGQEYAFIGLALSTGDYYNISIRNYELEDDGVWETIIDIKIKDEAASNILGISYGQYTQEVFGAYPNETWEYEFIIEEGATVTDIYSENVSPVFFSFIAEFLNISTGA
jgi:hypothetical protein